MCPVFGDTQLVSHLILICVPCLETHSWRLNWYVSSVFRHTAQVVWRLNWYMSHVGRHTASKAFQMVCVPCLETHSWSGVSVCLPCSETHSWFGVSVGMCSVFGDTQLVWRLNWYVSRVWRYTAVLASHLVCVPFLEIYNWSGVSIGMCPSLGDTQLVLRLNWYVSRVWNTGTYFYFYL